MALRTQTVNWVGVRSNQRGGGPRELPASPWALRPEHPEAKARTGYL